LENERQRHGASAKGLVWLMRVVLSGTSNSILAKSVSFAFANDPAVTHFANISYGASGSVALGDHLRKIDFSQFDFCVFDYCVNEEGLIRMKQSSVNAAINNLSAAIDAASRVGCQPIILVFPISKQAIKSRPFEDAVMKTFSRLGVPVFNFYNFAPTLIASSGVPY
jgi:hypothetical protein